MNIIMKKIPQKEKKIKPKNFRGVAYSNFLWKITVGIKQHKIFLSFPFNIHQNQTICYQE